MRTIIVIALLLVGGCLVGCVNKSKNHREVGFRWGTEFVFIDRTAKTSGADPNDAYESSVEAPAFVEWFFPAPAPTPGTVPP
jgi:hypothetical protein